MQNIVPANPYTIYDDNVLAERKFKMNQGAVVEKGIRIADFNGIEVFHIPTDKYKTESINIFFYDNLCRENASLNAMVPAVMRRGTARHPSYRELSLKLEELYGASFDCGVSKKGELQLIHFYMDFVRDRYTGSREELFKKSLDLLMEIIMEPMIERVDGQKDCFRGEIVEQEKKNLKNLIEGRINDKQQYSLDRCFEEMCRLEPFSIYDYGYKEDLDAIRPDNLYEQYGRMLHELPVKVFLSGAADDGKLQYLVDRLKSIPRMAVKAIDLPEVTRKVEEVREVTERLDVTQGKLCMGFRTNTPPWDRDYYALMVYNGILGGGVHSKLFQNVREKESLAYYAFSRLEKFKGLMVISSGIETENKEKARAIIELQLEDMKSGNITDQEMEATQKSIETGLSSLKDSQLNVVDFYLSQVIGGTGEDFDTILAKVRKVTREDVVRIADRVQLDTVYFLTSTKDGRS